MSKVVDMHDWERSHRDDSEETGRVLDVSELVEAAQKLASVQLSVKPHTVQEIRIENFRSERYELVRPLTVYLEERGNQYIAESFDTGQYGHGFSPDDALESLCAVLEDYYECLQEEPDLGSNLESHLRYLKCILRERQ